ncbi:MAG: MATE family efflux transporter [Pyrinomonadaceae bacterium]
MHNSTEPLAVNGEAGAQQIEPGIVRTIIAALRGTHQDYTQGNLGRALLMLAIPMVLEMAMESVFALVDIFFVSKLGAEAAATVGWTESIMTLVYTVALGLSIGATATVARRIGERNPEAAAHTAAQVIMLGLTVSAVLGITGALLAPKLLLIMGAAPSVIAHNVGFTRVLLGCNASVMMLFLFNGIFRGAGDAAIAMRVLWLANILNIVLCPLLIFGFGPIPALGIKGAAIATTIGRGTGALFALSRMLKTGGRIPLAAKHFRPELGLIWQLIRLSSSAMFQVFIGMASWIGLIRIMAIFGTDAVAGNTIGMRVILFALFPSWGVSNAAATMVGQSLGAKDPERAEKAVWLAGFYNMCFLGVVGLIFVVFAGPIIRFFTQEPQVQVYGTACLRTVAVGFLFYAYGMVLTQSFNGAGDTRTPTIINLFVFWLFEIPLAYVLSVWFGLGPQGNFLAITIAFSALAVVSAIIFKQGKWKTQRV